MPATYEPIATITVSGTSTTQITFSGIAASWTDLRLIVVAGGNTDNKVLRYWLNNDNGTLMSETILAADGASARTTRSTSGTKLYLGGAYSGIPSATDQFGLYTLDIFSYAGSTNKTTLVTASGDKNGSGELERNVGLFRSTAAITRIDIDTNGSYLKPGTTATLYGILKA